MANDLLTRPLMVRSVSILGASIGFWLPLSVVPLFAKESGSAGLATVALLLATVLGELLTPRLAARLGYRWSLGLGLTLLGAPTALLIVSSGTATIVAVSVVRGIGFAICVVAGGALTAEMIPAERRGEGLALIGMVGGVSGLIALPAGVWAADRWGFSAVFAATAVLTLAALVSLPGLPHTTAAWEPGTRLRLHPALRRPAAVFAFATAAVGVLVTFLPLAVAGSPAWVASAALLAQPSAATAFRWIAGRLGDRTGSQRLLVPGVLLTAAGMAGLAWTGSPAAVIGGALVFGAGFGLLQNATLALMYDRAPAGAALTVSAIWNIAYDLGMAGGALIAGFVISGVGYPLTFLLTAVAMLPALALCPARPASPPETAALPALGWATEVSQGR
ncbi:MFS family permease [Actinoplanes octamycinicus]|uniref:MFS family permease n=1 Tax=Actinoplanes octamycinicus TaxID=135948 RepID=A0A7W7M9T5_9ACTN|nr:MFS transporter [Actinoplanes octamycinicus]MBB4742368.1 MFS family permease [Actinoplanes octamycinicus]GIE62383.1 MFS transporter [Actinoplanes octamycinicus]